MGGGGRVAKRGRRTGRSRGATAARKAQMFAGRTQAGWQAGQAGEAGAHTTSTSAPAPLPALPAAASLHQPGTQPARRVGLKAASPLRLCRRHVSCADMSHVRRAPTSDA